MKKQSIIWLLAIVLWLTIMPLRGLSLFWATIAHSFAFAILTWWAMKKLSPMIGFWRAFIPLTAPWLVELVCRIFVTPGSSFSLPVSVLPLFTVFTIMLFFRLRNKVFPIICAVLCVFCLTKGHRQWYEWFYFGNFPVNTVNLADCEVSDSTHTFKLADVDSEYLVIGCGFSIENMPEVQALRDEYKDNDKVEVVTLYACLHSDDSISNAYSIMKDLGCNLPVYCVEKDSPILSDCIIQGYSSVLILNRDRVVIFNGSLDFAKRKLKKLIKTS